MKLRIFARTAALIGVVVCALGVASAAMAASDDIQHYEGVLAETAEELVQVRESIATLEEMIAEGRYHFSYLPVGGSEIPVIVTQEESLKFWAMQYVLSREAAGEQFTTAGLANFLKEIREVSHTIKKELEDTIAALEARERALMKTRGELEQKVSDLSGPQRTGRCVDLQRVERWRELGEAAYVNPGAREHEANHIADTGRGWTANITFSWTAPPDRICVGESFGITLTVTNNAPVQDPNLARAAQISLRHKPGVVSVACGTEAAATVRPSDGSDTSTCTVTVNNLGDGTREIDPIGISLTAIPLSGGLNYIYK